MMKNLLFLMIVFSLFDCTSDQLRKTRHSQSDNNHTNDIVTVPNIDFDGIWVNKNYINSLIENKSVKKSQISHILSYIDINIDADSTCTWVWNFHERKQDRYIEITDNEIKLTNGSNIIFESDSLAMATYGDEVERLVKIKTRSKNHNRIPEEIIITALFSNSYILKSPWNEISTVSFNLDGSLDGITGYNKFSICYDKISNGLDYDLINLYNQSVLKERFIWDFNSDTLNIFRIKCNNLDSPDNKCDEFVKDDIVYQLIRS